jgi:hypothetical protein
MPSLCLKNMIRAIATLSISNPELAQRLTTCLNRHETYHGSGGIGWDVVSMSGPVRGTWTVQLSEHIPRSISLNSVLAPYTPKS